MSKNIEFVCAANNGKSPVALAVARDYVGKIGNYDLSSTGTMVDVISKSMGKGLVKYLDPFCKVAYEKSILSQEELDKLETDPREVLEKLLLNERNNRNKYLQELSLGFDDSPIQTTTIGDSQIIACIGKSNLKNVQDLYRGLTPLPEIIDLIGNNYSNIDNQWVLTYSEFRDVGSVIRQATIDLLENIL